MGIEQFAWWLLKDALGPEVVAMGAAKLARRSSRRKLAAAVRAQVGFRPGRTYKKWLKSPETRGLLELQATDAFDRLVDSLEAAERATGREPDHDRCDALVTSTIVNFLESLDPAQAVNLHELRSEARHLDSERRHDERYEEVLRRVTPKPEIDERLQRVSPRVRAVLREGVPTEAVLSVLEVAEADDPKREIAGLVQLPPLWFRDPDGALLLAAAELAVANGLHLEAAALFERAGDRGTSDRQSAYVNGAHAFMLGGNREGSDRCLDKAKALGPSPVADALRVARDGDGDILDALDESTASWTPLSALLYAEGLRDAERLDEAIAFLEGRVEAWPEEGAVGLRLSRLLLERSTLETAVDRRRDLRRAADVALQVRDARRCWGGNSVEGTEVAAQALLVMADFEEVIRVGRVAPNGEATPEEAASSEVAFAVVQSLLVIGDQDAAREVASSTSGFEGLLLLADVLAASDGDRQEIEDLYRQAWGLAANDQQKHTLWISAAGLGMDPMPGDDELDSDPDFALLVRATNQVSLGHADEAIRALRPVRSRRAREALVLAYMDDGQVDAAVAELRDMYGRFNDPDYLVRAVNALMPQHRVQDAAGLAVQALATVPGGHPGRLRLAEVCVAAAIERQDWAELEQHARLVIREHGATPRRRWPLILALVQQAHPDDAWAVLQDGGVPEVEASTEAQLWMILHGLFALDASVLDRCLDFAEQFPDDPEVRRIAVNLWITAGDGRGEVTPETAQRWQQQIDLRATRPSEGDSFQILQFGDDPDAMFEVLRPLLEAQAARLEEWSEKVARDGFPIGFLALAVGRPYCLTLASRPLGFSPTGTPDPRSFEEEVEAASRALDAVVVADLSAVLTGWYIGELWSRCLASFQRVEVLPSSRRDLMAEVQTPDLPSEGTLGWDLGSDRPVLQEPDEEAVERLREHLRWVADQVDGMSDHSWTQTNEMRPTPWGDSVEAARAAALTLWADDAGLRAMAKAAGVHTFSTHALLVAMERAGLVEESSSAEALVALRSEYCVDFPLDPTWTVQNARETGFLGGPALVVFARKSTWQNLAAAYEVWNSIATEAGQDDPLLVPRWVYAGATGIFQLFSPAIASGDTSTASELVSRLGVAGIGAGGAGAVPGVLGAAAEASRKAGTGDPAEQILEILFDQLTTELGPELGAQALANLCTDVEDGPHRDLVRKVLFGPK